MAIVVAAALSLPFVAVLIGWPLLRRLAIRNTHRRPVEALLVVGGSLLGTAIITGSLIVGDTIDRSIVAGAYDQLGPIDEVVAVPLDRGDEVRARLESFASPLVDGRLSFSTTGAAVASGDGTGIQPRAQLIEVDFAAARRFGSDAAATGITGRTPVAGSAAVSRDLADKLGLDVGSEIAVFAGGGSASFSVDRVLARRGVAGYWTVDTRQQSYNVFVPPGTIAAVTSTGTSGDHAPPQGVFAFSNVGGVERGAQHSQQVAAAIDRSLEGVAAKARPVKRNLLDVATAAGDSLTQLYFTIGMFAVAAGVLLLVNVFVMLADERRSELGMLRAMGMRRSLLVGGLATEGWLYALLASALGAALGIAFGWLIAWRADAILSSGREENALHLTFSFHGATVVTGFALGLAISIVTIVGSSARIARFNVIQAIRDVHVRNTVRRPGRRTWIGAVLLAGGVGLSLVGFAGPEPFSVMIGPMLAVVGLAVALAPRVRARLVTDVCCVAVLVWAIASIPVVSALGVAIEIPMFLVQGLSMTAAAVTMLVAHLDGMGAAVGRGGRETLVPRLGLAYPRGRRFRTGMTLAMFAVIVLTLVYMGQVSYMFRGRADSISGNLSGGFGVVVQSNPSDPVTPQELASLAGIRRVAPLGYAAAEFTTPTRDRMQWPVTGIGPELATAPPVLRDRGTFATDHAAWDAVARDPDLAIVDDFFLQTAGGPNEKAATIGDRIVMTDPTTGRSKTLRVVGLAENDFVLSGAYVNQGAFEEVFQERAAPSRFFVSATRPEAAVRRIRSTFVAHGADAQTVHSTVSTALSQNSGFLTLMQQFVGAGLLVGVAGIGVIMFRAVRERRREVGVLRSLGFPRSAVGNTFMFEAGFVSALGVLLGVVTALVASYVLAVSGADFAQGFEFGVPYGEVLVIVAIAVGSAVVAALIPARRASRIQPAVSLRVAD